MQQNPISSIRPYIWTNVNFVRDGALHGKLTFSNVFTLQLSRNFTKSNASYTIQFQSLLKMTQEKLTYAIFIAVEPINAT